MIFALYNVFEEADNLPRAMDSVDAQFDEVVHVTVDGRYPDFPADHDYSLDGTREIGLRRGELLVCLDYECEKRSFGLRHIDTLAQDGDWVLSLDADEELTAVFGWPTRVGSFSFSRASRPVVTYGRCRLYRWEPGLHFSGRHYDLYDRNGVLVSSLEDAPDYQVIGTGIHHDNAHGPERRALKTPYYRVLREREGHPSERVRA